MITLKEQKCHDSQLFSGDTHYSREDYQRKHPVGTRHPRNVPWKSPKESNVWDLQGTFRRLSGRQYKNCFSEVTVLALHGCFIFYRKNKYSKVINGDAHGTSMAPNSVTSREPNDGSFYGCPWDVHQTCFFKLNSQTH